MARGKKTDTTGPNFKGDPSVGGRKGGVISRHGVDPTATDAIMDQASDMGNGGQAPASGGPRAGTPTTSRPQGVPAPQGQSVFDELSNSSRPQRSPHYQEAMAGFEDPYLFLKNIAARYPNPDVINLLRKLNG